MRVNIYSKHSFSLKDLFFLQKCNVHCLSNSYIDTEDAIRTCLQKLNKEAKKKMINIILIKLLNDSCHRNLGFQNKICQYICLSDLSLYMAVAGIKLEMKSITINKLKITNI
eukprot:Pgem_evm1s2549